MDISDLMTNTNSLGRKSQKAPNETVNKMKVISSPEHHFNNHPVSQPLPQGAIDLKMVEEEPLEIIKPAARSSSSSSSLPPGSN